MLSSDSEAGALEIGPVKVTMQELYVSVISSLIILPLNIVIDLLFRRSKPKPSHKTDVSFAPAKSKKSRKEKLKEDEDIQAIRNRIFQVMNCPDVTQDGGMKKDHAQNEATDLGTDHDQGCSPNSAVTTPPNIKNEKVTNSQKSEEVTEDPTEKAVTKKAKCKTSKQTSKQGKVMLPHWCVYIAWFLVISMSAVSTFITFSYSMEWGKEKSNAWLCAMLLSVGQSVMVVQPIKVSL